MVEEEIYSQKDLSECGKNIKSERSDQDMREYKIWMSRKEYDT